MCLLACGWALTLALSNPFSRGARTRNRRREEAGVGATDREMGAMRILAKRVGTPKIGIALGYMQAQERNCRNVIRVVAVDAMIGRGKEREYAIAAASGRILHRNGIIPPTAYPCGEITDGHRTMV